MSVLGMKCPKLKNILKKSSRKCQDLINEHFPFTKYLINDSAKFRTATKMSEAETLCLNHRF